MYRSNPDIPPPIHHPSRPLLTALVYGGVAVGLAFIAGSMGGVLQAAVAVTFAVAGPLMAAFIMAIFMPFTNAKVSSIHGWIGRSERGRCTVVMCAINSLTKPNSSLSFIKVLKCFMNPSSSQYLCAPFTLCSPRSSGIVRGYDLGHGVVPRLLLRQHQHRPHSRAAANLHPGLSFSPQPHSHAC